MIRPILRLGTASLLLGTLPVLAACSAPATAMTKRCTGGPLSGSECVVAVEQLDKQTSTRLENGNYRSARIDATFTVQSGSVDIELAGRGDQRQLTVTPENPQRVQLEVTLIRPASRDDDNYFRVTYTPREPSTGVRGEITYSRG